jgi:GTPase
MAEEMRRRRKAKALDLVGRGMKMPAVPLPDNKRLSSAAEEETGAGPSRKADPARKEGARRCGFIALIGAPNVGKSTLINALVGSKVAIVSHKAQTTRSLLRGITTAGRSQLIFIDTPGIFAPKRRLDRAMVTSAWAGAHDADIIGLILDATRGVDEQASVVLAALADIRHPKILLINKVDLVEKSMLLDIAGNANGRMAFAATFMISALTGDGVGDVKNWLADHVSEGPWHYPEDQITDAPLRQLAAEITREKLYVRLHQELPYRSTVETDRWQERKDGSIRIEQTIYVERESQRKIVLGKGGRTLKAIGTDARSEIAGMIEAPVHLFLFVKVRENWSDDRDRYRAMGLEFPKE